MNYENEEVIQLTMELVTKESTNVGTFEGEVSAFVADWMREQTGLEVIRDEYAPGRFNVYCTFKGKQAHPNLIYIAHMDTAPVGNGWTRDPFKPELEGNKLYGRGACDMKAGLAAAMIAFRDFVRKCRAEGITPKYDFVFVGSADEEDAMGGADRVADLGIADKQSLVLDTEPSMSTERAIGNPAPVPSILCAHKGKTWFEITTYGVAAHGSNPPLGVDAIVAMSEVVLELKNRIAQYPIHPVMGPSTICFGTIHGGCNTNVVADSCTITIDMRLSPPLTKELSIQLVEDAVAAGTARVPGSRGESKVLSARPYIEQNDDSYLLKELRAACKETLGVEAKIVFFTGYTDSGVLDGRTGCGNAMSFGPDGEFVHRGDEYVLCNTVVDTLRIIQNLADRILL